MNADQIVRLVGVLSLVGIAVVLSFDGVPESIVVLLVGAILTIVAPDALKQTNWGPF